MQTSHECSVNILRKQWLLVFSGLDYRGIRSESSNSTCDGDKLPLICGVVENNALCARSCQAAEVPTLRFRRSSSCN